MKNKDRLVLEGLSIIGFVSALMLLTGGIGWLAWVIVTAAFVWLTT